MQIPKDFPVRPLLTARQRAEAKDIATCETCGRSWDDDIPTEYTPTPSARCPFEAFHEREADDHSAELAGINSVADRI